MQLPKIVILLFSLLLLSFNIYSQDDIKNYKPPKLMKGFNLTLETSPGISLYSENNGSNDYSYEAGLDAGLEYWRFTDNFLFSVYSDVNMAYSKEKYDQNTTIDKNFGFDVTSGASYYFLSTNFYANLFLNTSNQFGNNQFPSFLFELYPGIGYGRLYNAARVSQMQNFEKVLLNEKIISSPLKNDIRKKLIELLDKRNNRDFLSMFKEDDEIEFFSRVEDLLKDNEVIQGNLGSKAILKMFQALYIDSYIYFPKYKGFLVQAESKLYTQKNEDVIYFDPYQSNNNYCFYYFNEIMLSGIYGLPVNNKLSFVGSAYTLFPLPPGSNKYLNNYLHYDFHSPITLLEQNQLYYNFHNLQQYDDNYIEGATKMDIGFDIQGFYSFNSFCGLSTELFSNIKLKNYSDNKVYGGINSFFNFNILNHLKLSLGIEYSSDKMLKRNFSFGTDVTYYVF